MSRDKVSVGAHVSPTSPLATASAIGADSVQIFLSDPQGWKKPPPRDDAAELRASSVPVYVHAPYLINVASPNNKIRVPSRRILQDTCDAAAEVGAAAVIVHAGHADDDIGEGIARWARTMEIVQSEVPVYIENTAGGDNAMARRFDVLARLWEAVGPLGAGFCFDTCHAHAAGEELSDAVERVLAIVGRIDLVNANDSRDPAGTGRDRHTNLGSGTIGPEVLRDMLRACRGAPVVCETPGGPEAVSADLTFVRQALGA